MRPTTLIPAVWLALVSSTYAQAPATSSGPAAQSSQRDRMKSCNAEAKTQGLKGSDRKTFLSSCLSGTTASTPAVAPKTSAPSPVAASRPGPAAPAPAASGGPVFPSAVSAKYSSESAGKARMHTCLDQYNANKATNGNGGLNWIAKGGGYYSECNKRLKG